MRDDRQAVRDDRQAVRDGQRRSEAEALGFLGSKDLETQFIQYNLRLQNMTNEEKLCSVQPMFNPNEDVSVDMLKNFEVNEVTQMKDYLKEKAERCEVFQIEPEIIIALDKEQNEMKINVILDKPEKS
ncbi:hypothetical protein Syun_023258 [Stephania yunnanensis]|uniref:Uncharacterized protein n=1 Tax=Stephania yunnanensis TaxID=152371 RepID=A0AAP0I253_9MAGN